MTQQEQLVKGLEVFGLRELSSTSRKYRRFTSEHESFSYWIGKAGALRFGETVSTSRAVGDGMKQRVFLAAERAQYAE